MFGGNGQKMKMLRVEKNENLTFNSHLILQIFVENNNYFIFDDGEKDTKFYYLHTLKSLAVTVIF